ncbi:MAG TPA: hypothetical protein VIN32_07225 [Candidatus Limnocylindria bacterium]
MSCEFTTSWIVRDNLDILRRYLPAAAVDLVYLDPPFNSDRQKAQSPSWTNGTS